MSDDQDAVLDEATKRRLKLWQMAARGIRALIDHEPVSAEEAVVVIDIVDDDGWRFATTIMAHDDTGESLEMLRTQCKIVEENGDAIPIMVLVMAIDEAIAIIPAPHQPVHATLRKIRSAATTDMPIGMIVAAGGMTAVVVPRAQYTNKAPGPFTTTPVVGIS